jgi:tetratricopeptide (TPR) repeat protein
MHRPEIILALASLLVAPAVVQANSHREAPTALDGAAAIRDFYAFVSPEDSSKVTFVLSVYPAIDPGVVYAIKIDNNGDAKEDVSYEFLFRTEIGASGPRQTYSVAKGTNRIAGSLRKDAVVSLPSGMRVFASAADIAIEVPAAAVTAPGSSGLGAWAAVYRSRISVRRAPGPDAVVQIQRVGSPVTGGSQPDLLKLDTTVRSGFPNGRRLTDDVMAIALGAASAPPLKGNYAAKFPYVKAAAGSEAAAGDQQIVRATGYIQKLRETGDGSYLDRASRILDGVLARDGANYEALRLRNEIALHLHEFGRVEEESRKLSARSPQDPRNWGSLGDALMEMGEYDKAAAAYQRMVELRPGLSSLNRVAFYRFVTGDTEGAIAAMNDAIGAGSPVPENLAWCLTDLGWMYFKTGRLTEAAAAFGKALRVFPGYHRAYAGRGQTLAAQGKSSEAIESYKRAQAVVPMPDYAAALTSLYESSGNEWEGKKQKALLDMLDQIGQSKGETTNRNLAVVYADQERKLDRALQLAQAELKSRRDIYTYDALAWALYKNKRYAEAEKASAKALQMKTAEPAFYYHAGMIKAALHKQAEGKQNLEHALQLNPRFDPSQAVRAKRALATLCTLGS